MLGKRPHARRFAGLFQSFGGHGTRRNQDGVNRLLVGFERRKIWVGMVGFEPNQGLAKPRRAGGTGLEHPEKPTELSQFPRKERSGDNTANFHPYMDALQAARLSASATPNTAVGARTERLPRQPPWTLHRQTEDPSSRAVEKDQVRQETGRIAEETLAVAPAPVGILPVRAPSVYVPSPGARCQCSIESVACERRENCAGKIHGWLAVGTAARDRHEQLREAQAPESIAHLIVLGETIRAKDQVGIRSGEGVDRLPAERGAHAARGNEAAEPPPGRQVLGVDSAKSSQ